jgi:type II secretory pathway component PulF
LETRAKSPAGRITLEQLVALNDEMAALVRSGVPLEQGLGALGGELPGKPGRLAQLLASRMNAGESLAQILASDDGHFPPVWRAVVEAGIRSGHLAAALESLSSTARRTAELRKLVGAGILYPIVVVTLAYVLFVFLVTWLAPLTLRAQMDLTGASDAVLARLDWIGRMAAWWVVPVPLVVATLLGWRWYRSGRLLWSKSVTARPWRWARWTRWLRCGAGIKQTLHNGRMATFAEVLSLLVKQQVPMEDSIVLAAEASGDGTITRASRQIAERLRRGEVLKHREDLPGGFSPLLGWLLLTSNRQPELSQALSHSASVYRHRAERAGTWTAIYVPIFLTVVLGGTATLICGLVTVVPIARLLYHLSLP